MVTCRARAAVVALRQLIENPGGSTAIEYALLAAVVSITALAGLQAFAGSMDEMYNVVIATIVVVLAGG
jgi:Flp pilus assembly pilin Flp